MLNVETIANIAIQSINPDTPAILRRSDGYTTTDYEPVPQYAADVAINVQVQMLSSADLKQIDQVNQGGEMRVMMLPAQVYGVSREREAGGDLIIIESASYAGTWLVTQIIRQYSDWTKVAVCLQVAS